MPGTEGKCQAPVLNLNPVPVEVQAVEACYLHGQEYEPGDVFVAQWRFCKALERTGVAERVYRQRRNREPVRDVLVFTPVLRLEPETVARLMTMEFDGAVSMLFQRDNPEAVPAGAMAAERKAIGVRNHLHQYRRGRETFLAGPWDAMLVIESDILPPADALEKLIRLQADVAYGVYTFQGSPCVNVFERYPANAATGEPARNVGQPLTVRKQILRRALREGKIDCSGGGLGCVLIRRKVLEAVPFRMPENDRVHCDTPWTTDVYRAGFSQRADLTVVCGHKAPGVDGTPGDVVWPPWVVGA